MKKQGAFFYILIALTLAVLAFLLVYLMPSSNIDTPPVILPTPQAAEMDTGDNDGSQSGAHAVLVTPETVQTVIGELERADNYSRTLTVESFWDGGKSQQEISVWVRDDSAKLVIQREGAAAKHVLLQNREKWIWYSDSDDLFHGIAGERDTDEYQTLLSYEDVLDMDASLIRDAGYADYAGEGCIYVRYADGELAYENICYVSVATGLLVGSESYDGDTLIYRMHSSATDLSTPDDAVFETP